MKEDDKTLYTACMGEFQELAWQVKIELKPSLTSAEQQLFNDRFISFMEANQLGWAGELADFVVVSLPNRSNVTLTERRLVKHWLMQRPEVETVLYLESSGTIDAWMANMLYNNETPAFTKFFS
ncbi:MAG: 50S ribosome-binding protein YggL [Janthinobacterium lividum]